jgi:hypothetical protein
VTLIVQDANRQWGSRQGRPRQIRDIELVDIFSLTQSAPANFVRLLLAVVNPAILDRQARPGTQSLQAIEIMRDMLSVRVMQTREKISLQIKLQHFGQLNSNTALLSNIMGQICFNILAEPQKFPALLTNLELFRLLNISENIGNSTSNFDFLLGGATAAASGAQAGRAVTSRAASTFAGALGAYVGMLANTTGNHYGSYATAYKLELTRRGVYVR